MRIPVSASKLIRSPKDLVVNMIEVTRLNNKVFVLNCEWIETVEATPDTVITLTNGKKYVVAETVEDIVQKVIEYKQKLLFHVEK